MCAPGGWAINSCGAQLKQAQKVYCTMGQLCAGESVEGKCFLDWAPVKVTSTDSLVVGFFAVRDVGTSLMGKEPKFW